VQRRIERPTGDKELALPPADFVALDPVITPLAQGSHLLRIYTPLRFGAAPLRFREWGPYNRFDHQRASLSGARRVDRGRGVLYAGFHLVGPIGEVFGDSGEVTRVGYRLARLTVRSQLDLLDLRGTAATGAGTIQAIAAVTQRETTQAWARWWYEHPQLAGVHGVRYVSAHSGEDAVAFWERARGRLSCRPGRHWGLDDPRLEGDVLLAASRLRLPVT
jgi:hypothetical protein